MREIPLYNINKYIMFFLIFEITFFIGSTIIRKEETSVKLTGNHFKLFLMFSIFFLYSAKLVLLTLKHRVKTISI